MPSGVYTRTEECNRIHRECQKGHSGVYKHSVEHNKNISKTGKVAQNRLEVREARRLKMKEIAKSQKWRLHVSQASKIAQNKPEVKIRKSIAMHKHLEISDYRSTDIENIMKNALIKEGYNFKKNKYIDCVGNVDFLLTDYNIIIECDGEVWHSKPDKIAEDKRRDTEAAKLGYRTLRFKGNAEIKKDIQQCMNVIKLAITCLIAL